MKEYFFMRKCLMVLLTCVMLIFFIQKSDKIFAGDCNHENITSKSYYAGMQYTYSPNRVCYNTMERTDYKCSTCREEWYIEVPVSAAPHAWEERFDYEDGRYTYYKKVCLRCDCKVFSRKVEGPVMLVDEKADSGKE